jgi:hypothetical protein
VWRELSGSLWRGLQGKAGAFDPKVPTSDTVAAGDAVAFLVQRSRQYTSEIEVMGYLIGTGDDYLDRFTLPKVLGIASENRDLLDPLVHFSGLTSTMFASDLDRTIEQSLGVRISYCHHDCIETNAFLAGSQLVTVRGQPLVCYLSPLAREKYWPGADPADISDTMLAAIVRERGCPVTTLTQTSSEGQQHATRRYMVLPETLEVGQFGLRNSYYPIRQVLRRVLSPDNNKFDSGLSYGDIHIHPSSTRRRASPEQRDMMDAIGADYYRLPSAYDVVTFYGSFSRMEKYGLDTKTVVRGIVALTDADDPTRRELLGTSFLDLRAVTNDQRVEKELLTRAEKANETKSFEDVKRYFDMVKSMVTEDMPDFVDTSRPKDGPR